MGLFDALFGNRNQIPTVTTILPDAARQEIIAGRLPILNTDKLFLKRGEKIHFIDKAINLEQKTVKEFRHVGGNGTLKAVLRNVRKRFWKQSLPKVHQMKVFSGLWS